MNVLHQFFDRHPLFAGAVGSVSGFGPAVLRGLHLIAGPAADVGTICGAIASLFAALTVFRRWYRERKADGDAAIEAYVDRHQRRQAARGHREDDQP